MICWIDSKYLYRIFCIFVLSSESYFVDDKSLTRAYVVEVNFRFWLGHDSEWLTMQFCRKFVVRDLHAHFTHSLAIIVHSVMAFSSRGSTCRRGLKQIRNKDWRVFGIAENLNHGHLAADTCRRVEARVGRGQAFFHEGNEGPIVHAWFTKPKRFRGSFQNCVKKRDEARGKVVLWRTYTEREKERKAEREGELWGGSCERASERAKEREKRCITNPQSDRRCCEILISKLVQT